MSIAAGATGAATAQPMPPPESEVPLTPAKEAPAPSPFALEASEPTAEPRSLDAGGGEFEQVIVTADKDAGADALPPRNWQPPQDKIRNLSLMYRPGQPLDQRWVQSQFDAALGSGAFTPSGAIALTQLINRAFISAGFINSGILVDQREGPAGAVLKLRLVYGQIGKSDVSDPAVIVDWNGKRSSGLSSEFVRARFSSARARPLNAFELERDFRLLDESDSIQSISAALRPGARPGEASLHLLVKPANRFDLYTGAANDRSPSVGGDRIFAGGSARNLLWSGDRLSAEAGITEGIKDAQASYSAPIFLPALTLDLQGSFDNAGVITPALAPLDIRTKDKSVEAGLTYAFRREPLMMRGGLQRWAPSETLSAGLHFLHRRQRSYLLDEPFSFAPGSVDGRSKFTVARMSGDYLRRDQSRVIALSLGTTLGLGGTRSDIPGIDSPKRHLAVFFAQLNFAQRLGSVFELRGRLIGQHSRGLLYSGLRLAVGGASTVRGYRENLFLVDRGVVGSVELAREINLSGDRRGNGFNWGAFSASVFADGAAFRNAAPPQPEQKSIGSVGAALAWTPSPSFEAGIAYGHALRDVPVPGKRSLQDRGFHFRVMVRPLSLF